jgi:hypothetical protein
MGATTNCTVVHYGTTWDDFLMSLALLVESGARYKKPAVAHGSIRPSLYA